MKLGFAHGMFAHPRHRFQTARNTPSTVPIAVARTWPRGLLVALASEGHIAAAPVASNHIRSGRPSAGSPAANYAMSQAETRVQSAKGRQPCFDDLKTCRAAFTQYCQRLQFHLTRLLLQLFSLRGKQHKRVFFFAGTEVLL